MIIVDYDFKQVLEELDLQADRVLASLVVLREMEMKFTNMTDTNDKREYAEIMRFQVGILEMDLGVIKLDAVLMTDEQISEWIESATDSVEKEKREDTTSGLLQKLEILQEEMTATKRDMVHVTFN
ncbi:hypothetical protein N0V83_000311 [Neocucurbitaria cava]|uniref:Uncharacterized protein n=1 Tax=Neocucurbitaria cava TaxID=798079 RepID=A0A9W8YHK2_9PLEO|nr:hypothetical protein N0V83_000311 [Neocucurbitaria cava]